MAIKRIFRFSKEACDWTEDQAKAKKILGGKGAGLVMMAQAEMPVPPGFTITTEVCNQYRQVAAADTKGGVGFLDSVMDEVKGHDKWLAEKFGYYPLVSVRSGAPVSMPGMMDTILNVGLTDASLPEWAERIGEKAALDSYRRLIQMLGSTACGIDHDVFEFQLAKAKKEAGIALDHELSVAQLVKLVQDFKWAFKEAAGIAFPQNRYDQLEAAIGAVFNSWMNERAIQPARVGLPCRMTQTQEETHCSRGRRRCEYASIAQTGRAGGCARACAHVGNRSARPRASGHTGLAAGV